MCTILFILFIYLFIFIYFFFFTVFGVCLGCQKGRGDIIPATLLLATGSTFWSDPRLCMAPLCVLNFLAGTEWPFWWSFGTIFVPYLSLLKVTGVAILYLPSSFLTTDLDLLIGCSATHSLICLQLHLVPFSTILVAYLSLLRVSEGVGILYLPSSFLTTDLDLLIGCSATHSLICLQLHLVPFSTIFVPYLSLLRVSEGVGILYLPSSFLTTDLDLLIGCSATHSLICLQLHLVPFSTIFVPYLSLLRVSEGAGILYLPSSSLTTDLDLLIGCSATHSLISVFNFMVGTPAAILVVLWCKITCWPENYTSISGSLSSLLSSMDVHYILYI